MSTRIRFCQLALVILCGVPIAVAVYCTEGQASESEDNASGGSISTSTAADRDRDEYYELFLVLADTIDQIDRNYVEPISRRELMEAAIDGILKKLDPFSNYIAADEKDDFEDEIKSEFGGIGIQISVQGGGLKVISPLVGTPAHRNGIMAGDRILAIDDKSTEGISIDDAVHRMKGRAGTAVTLTVRHAHDGSTEDIELTREVIRVATVMGDRRNKEGKWEYMYDDAAKIGYIRLTAFSEHTASELREALTSLSERELRGLVLDLRFNPGGLLSSAIEVSDLFLSSGRIVSTAGRNVRERAWEAREEGTLDDFELAILVNQYSASASEIVAACVQDHGRGVIVGERTWGKGSVQNVIPLEDGQSVLKLTTASYVRPSGKNIHRFDTDQHPPQGIARNSDSSKEPEGEWGVQPNDGLQVRLSNREMGLLIADRRRRDILHNTSTEADTDDRERFVDRQLNKAVDYLRDKLN